MVEGNLEGKEDRMNVTLPPELEEFVNERVQSGAYSSPGDVLLDGLRLLREHAEEQRKLEALRRDVAVGIEEADKGLVAPFDPIATLVRVRERRASRGAEGGS